MFIKILTPNHNGKVELTVKDLEALIQEAVDKAVREQCTKCNRYSSGFTYFGNNQLNKDEKTLDWSRTLCGSSAGPIVASSYANTTNDWQENKK
jgi:hypothetical protein